MKQLSLYIKFLNNLRTSKYIKTELYDIFDGCLYCKEETETRIIHHHFPLVTIEEFRIVEEKLDK